MASVAFVRRRRVYVIVGLCFVYITLMYNSSRTSQCQNDSGSVEAIKRLVGGQYVRILTKSSVKLTGMVFPHTAVFPGTIHSPYIIPNPYVCTRYLILHYIIVVHSAPANFQRRLNMRETWANHTVFKDLTSRVVFMLGSVADEDLQSAIYEESRHYGDIVQGDFVDDYKNLTLKAVMGLRWLSENCRHAEHIIKVDDDVFANIFAIREVVFPILSVSDSVLVCSVEPEAFIFRVNDPAEENIKWRVSNDFFPGLDRYPMPFCYGYGVMYSSALAVKFFELAKSTPFYRLDDVFVYGILASKVKDIVWYNLGDLYFQDVNDSIKASVSRTRTDFLIGTARTSETMKKLWNTVKRKYRS